MDISGFDPALIPLEVSVDEKMIRVRFESGVELATPLSRFPRLERASPEQRKRWRLIGRGDGIQWPDADEDVSVRGLISASAKLSPGDGREGKIGREALRSTTIRHFTSEEIISLRLRERVSQSDFARQLGVSPERVAQWERGERQPRGASAKLLSLVERNGLQSVA